MRTMRATPAALAKRPFSGSGQNDTFFTALGWRFISPPDAGASVPVVPLVDAAQQKATLEPSSNGVKSDPRFWLLIISMSNGRYFAANADFVCTATEDLAASLALNGWADFTPPNNYALQIPFAS